MMEKTKKRIHYLDSAKGIGIILVVIGHSITNQSNVSEVKLYYLLNLISQFHMPLFFFISGMLYKEINFEHPIQTGMHRIKQYYLPFIGYNLVFLLLHNFFASINFIDELNFGGKLTLKEYIYKFIYVITGHRETFGGALWFLGSLLIISILFTGIGFITNKIRHYRWIIISVIILVFVLFGLSEYCPTSFKLDVTLYSLAFFYTGFLCVKFDFINKIIILKWLAPILLFAGILFSLFSNAGVAAKNLDNFYIYFVEAICGILMVLIVSNYKLVTSNQFLTFCGKASMDIMAFHFLMFKPVSILIMIVYGLPDYVLAQYPVVTGIDGLWWMLYSTISLVLCLGIYSIRLKMKSYLISVFRRGKEHVH